MAATVPTEREEQAAGLRLLASIGADVYVSGTVRRAGDHPGTMQTPGIPDVEFFLPARGESSALLVKWEVKRQGGRLRPEQARYAALCRLAGVAHVVGPAAALVAYLRAIGRVRG